MSKIVEFIPKDPVPLTSSGTDFVSDNGEMKVTLTTDTATNANVMEISRSGDDTGVKWYPRAVLYVGENNMRDIIFNANYSVGASVHRQTHARYSDHFANIDDRFAIEAGQIKHYFSINAEQRAPLAFLKNPRLGFAGIIEIDPTWQIVGMGEPIATKTECIGALSVQDADGIERFQLPKVTAWDQSGNTTDGTFIVAPLKAGRYELIMCVPDAWLAQDSLVYPVVVDPTVVVASAYNVSYAGGQKIVKLSNGWIVSAVDNNTDVTLYVSKDNGQTFSQLCHWNPTTFDYAHAIAAVGTTVYLVTTGQFNSKEFVSFDATTVGNVDVSTLPTTVNMGSGADNATTVGASLAVGGDGAIHSTYHVQTTTYPNSYNVQYFKSVDGGKTFTNSLLTSYNISSSNAENSTVIVNAQNNPVIIYNDYISTSKAIKAIVWNGSAWTTYTIYSGTTTQGAPSAVIDSNGVIDVVWGGLIGSATVQQIIHSKSTDGGVTWSAPTQLTPGTTGTDSIAPSIGITAANDLYVLFHGLDSAISTSYYQIRQIVYTASTGTWGSATSRTSSTTVSQTNANVLWSMFNRNSADAIRYVWMTGAAVDYDAITVDQPPNAPTLTAHAAIDATQAATFAWGFSDPDVGNTPSAYQAQFVDTSTGNTVLDTGKVASTSSAYVLAANALTNGKTYQWRAKTWDQSGNVGPYSTYGTFNTSAPPIVTITSPATDGVTVGVNQVTVAWSESDPYGYPQGQYQAQLTDSTGATVLSDTGVVSDANARSRTIQYNLATGVSYKVKLTVWNNQGIASTVVTRAFLANYTSPVAPIAIVLPQATQAYNLVTADFPGPDPTTTQPDLASLDVYRRNTGDASWQRIAAAIMLGAKITFTRASAATNPNSLKQLGVNAPAYVPGKWSQAIGVYEGTTNLVFNSDFETVTNTATVFSDALTSYTGSSAAPWTVQSGSFNFGASGATSGAVTSIIKAGNSAWKPLVGSGGQNLALTAQATFTQPSTLPVMNAHLTLEIDANNRYRVEINTTGTWLSLGKIVNGTYTDLTSQTITALSVSHAYTFTLSLDHTGLLTAKLYDGTGTGGTLLQTLTATDTSLSGGFLLGVGGDTGVVISGTSVDGPVPEGWTLDTNGNNGVGLSFALETVNALSGSYSGSFALQGNSGRMFQSVGGLAASTTYVASAYIYVVSGSGFQLDVPNFTGISAGVTAIGKWTRVSVTFTTTTAGAYEIDLRPIGGYNVNATTTVYVDAVQVEQKSGYATPYLRNDSTSSSATRAAETATLPASVLNASAGTIAFWVNPSVNANPTGQFIFDGGGTGSHGMCLQLANLIPIFQYGNGSAPTMVTSPSSIPLNGWTRIVVKWSIAGATLYVGGIPVASSSVVPSMVFYATNAFIGSNNGGLRWLNGAIDEPTIWNRALTDAEVLADANATGPLTWQDGMTYLGHLDGGLYGVSTYADYAVASGQQYDYKVTANGNNGVSADSADSVGASGSVTVPGLQVFDPTNPAGTAIIIPMDVAQTSTWTASGEKLLFAGRTRPVVEFGETDEFTVKVSVIMKNADGLWAKLNALIRSKTTLCFKTPDGRKIFGVVLSLPEIDQLWGGQTVDLTIDETAYSEAV